MIGELYRNRAAQVAGDLAVFPAEELPGLPVTRVIDEGDPAARSSSSPTTMTST